MRFNVGDEVRVRTWESLYEEFGSPISSNSLNIRKGFNSDMRKLCGTVVTIQRVHIDGSYYEIEEDDWHWTDDMLESCVVDEVKVKQVVSLSQVVEGKAFSIAGIKMYKMYSKGSGYMCIFADPVFTEAYETSQNYAKSTIHRRLTQEVLPNLVEKIGEDNVLEFTLDLRHENDMNKYLDIQTKIGIMPYKEFRNYSGRALCEAKRHGFMFCTAYNYDNVLHFGIFGVDTCSIHTAKNIIPIVCLSGNLEVTYEG